MTFVPRPRQLELVEYYLAHGGRLGISAVPGSGKTHTLSYLAARLVVERLAEDQEVLIVTLVNSAVDNFRVRVAGFIEDMDLLPGMGYRVRTLHGLAHDIVRQRPGLAGLADDFVIVDEGEAARGLEEITTAWLRDHPDFDAYLALDQLGEKGLRSVQRRYWPELALNIARSAIKRAKDWQLTPEQLIVRLTNGATPLPLAAMVAAIYADYQRYLAARGGVDFDDLIRLAYHILELDDEFLARLRHQWPYVLEDEAQDSSWSQERMLRLLTDHPGGNWVRVGDPNQSIYHTFTNASPKYLRAFIREAGVTRRDLPESGRSQPAIIRLANRLIEWTQAEHPVTGLRTALEPPLIEPTPPGDPQPNPPDDPPAVQLIERAYAPADELAAIAQSVKAWLAGPRGAEDTVAVLVTTNRRGAEMGALLRQAGVPTTELLDTPPATRSAAGVLGNVLRHLSQPASSRQLATLFHVWQRADWDHPEERSRLRTGKAWLERLRRPEVFLWPLDGDDGWDQAPPDVRDDAALIAVLASFRVLVQRWQQAAALPVDQLILTVTQDLFTEATDLALAHKLAVELRHLQLLNPDWRLPELSDELGVIARNERRFMGFAEAAYQARPGEVTVATVHRAKGLEWDRVYLTAVNTYDYPSDQPEDTYIAERWFVRDRLNLEAEVLEQLRALHDDAPGAYVEGVATLTARRDYAAERLRLLYVGITRARKELIVTWNTGHMPDAAPDRAPKAMALPLAALIEWWQEGGL
jgi:DNA helicase-2/ATP-dependent DNA helicase PcrA